MHVLFIPSWYPKIPDDFAGGFFRDQVIALHKSGQKVGVIYPQLRSMHNWDSIVTGPKGQTIESDMGIPTYRRHGMAWFPRIPYANSWLWVWHGLQLFDSYIKRHGPPDIMHAHSLLNGGLLADAIYQRLNIPFVVTEHNSAFGLNVVPKWQKKLAAKAANHASARLAVSESFARALSIYFDGNKAWQFVPNILSPQYENASIEISGLQKSSFTFCNVSVLSPIKGVDLLIKAFARAFAGQSDILLRIGGDGEDRARLEALVRSLGVLNQVAFLGMLNRGQVLELMAQSDVYVLSSHIETFGVSVIEALALGKPVIATRCGGPESIVQKQDGFLIPKNDINGLAMSMKQMRNSYYQFDPVGIRMSCLKRFSGKAVTGQIVDIYKLVLSDRASLLH